MLLIIVIKWNEGKDKTCPRWGGDTQKRGEARKGFLSPGTL